MKSRKTRRLAALCLIAIGCFLVASNSFAEEETKEIKLDFRNAVQTIPKIFFKSNITNTNSGVFKNVEGKKLIQIITNGNNFVLSKGGSMASGSGSTILGGERNNVNNGNYSTILAGEENNIDSSYGVIGGGVRNQVTSNYGTIAGGQENVAKSYSTVLGGKNNLVESDYSVALGNDNRVKSGYSVAMGSGATVSGANSFLWSDNGATLNANNVFAVKGSKGMVVNTNAAHRFAQLTIGGSLLVNESSVNSGVLCGSETKGVLKVMNRTDFTGAVCFCSCDGTKWNSLFGAGKCSSICDNKAVQPVCNRNGVTKNCEGGKITYSGACFTGELVEGRGAFLIDDAGNLHWTCQTNDGTQQQCNGPIPRNDACTDPVGTFVCTGEPENAIPLGTNVGLTDNLGPKVYETQALAQAAVNAGEKCVYYCNNNSYYDRGYCLPRRKCNSKYMDNYEVPELADRTEQEVVRYVTVDYGLKTCRRTAYCDNSNVSWQNEESCSTSCDANFDLVNGKCIQNGQCSTTQHYECVLGTPSNTNYNSTTHKWTWTCAGINGGSNASCTLNEKLNGDCGSSPSHYTCVVGSVTSQVEDDEHWGWTCLGINGGEPGYCSEPKPCTVRTCSAYGLSSCPSNGVCSSCTPVDSVCVEGTKKYTLDSCKSGYHKEGNSCVADPTCTVVTCSSSTYPISGSCPAHGSCSECTPMSASCVAGSTVRKLNSCDTCSSTTYPLSSCPEGGNCSECTNYSKNGNSCTAGAKAYKLNSCKSGYTKSGNTCIPDDTDPTCTVVTCSSSTYPISGSCPANGSCSECTPMSASCVPGSTVRKLNSCDTCSTSTYPISGSCPANGSCSECTNYSKSGNSCAAGSKSYKLNSCDTCSSSTYPISGSCPDHGSCSECTNYSKNGNSCAAGSKSYKLNSCDTCSSTTYPLSSCPEGGNCSECTNYSKNGNSCTAGAKAYKLNSCKSGYDKVGNTCVPVSDPCEDYPLTSCPTGGSCSNCPSNSSKKKLDSCDTCSSTTYPLTSQGGVAHASSYSSCTSYTKNGNSCTAGSKRYRVSACVDQNGDAYATWPSTNRLGACPANATCSVYIPYSPSSDGKSCVAGTKVYHFDSCDSGFTETPAGSHNCTQPSGYSWSCETNSSCNHNGDSRCPSSICNGVSTSTKCSQTVVCKKSGQDMGGIWPQCAYAITPEDGHIQVNCCNWKTTKQAVCKGPSGNTVADSYCQGTTKPSCQTFTPADPLLP